MELTTVKTDKAKEYVRSTFNYNYSDIETITIDQVKDYVQKSKTTPWDIVRIEPTWDREALLKSALNEMISLNSTSYVSVDREINDDNLKGKIKGEISMRSATMIKEDNKTKEK